MQEAAGQVRRSFHQFEETHKVVAVDGGERLHSELHLRRVTHLVTKLLDLTARRKSIRRRKTLFSVWIENKCEQTDLLRHQVKVLN